MRKLTSEYVRGEFLKEGYTIPVGWEYVNNRTKIPFTCKNGNGHEHSIIWSSWNHGIRCMYCSKNAPINTEHVRAEFAKEGYVISAYWEYIDCGIKIPFTCKNGHEHSITWSSWNGQGSRCKYCSKIAPIGIEHVRAEFAKEGYIIPEDCEYVNAYTKIKYLCPIGHEHSVRWHDWYSSGTRCKYCGRAKANLKHFGHNKLYLYWIRIYDWIHGKWCYKFGITSHKDIKGRFDRASKKWGFKFEILERTTQASREQICQWEVDLLHKVKDYRIEWVPSEFGGYSECFVSSEAFARNIWNKVTLGW